MTQQTILNVGDTVLVENVRSNHLDIEKGIGWFAKKVYVKISRINDLTICFEFNGETHYELKKDCVLFNNRKIEDITELRKIKLAKDSLDYRLSVEYGITA